MAIERRVIVKGMGKVLSDKNNILTCPSPRSIWLELAKDGHHTAFKNHPLDTRDGFGGTDIEQKGDPIAKTNRWHDKYQEQVFGGYHMRNFTHRRAVAC